MPRFTVNDQVVLHQAGASTHPEPGARDIVPAEHGEMYSYVVDRLMRVVRVDPDGTIEAVDTHGRVTRIEATDGRLEKVRWWHRWMPGRAFGGAGNRRARGVSPSEIQPG